MSLLPPDPDDRMLRFLFISLALLLVAFGFLAMSAFYACWFF